MKRDEEIREARQQEERARAALLRLGAEVREALGEDLLEFPQWEVRRRFLAAPEFARTFEDERLAALKEELRQRTPDIRDQVIRAMEDEDLWFSGAEVEGNPGKSLAENPRLWAATGAVTRFIQEVLRRYGFPNAEDPVEYRMPMRFIRRKYLPGLAEKYWTLLADWREARARIRELEEGEVREDLARRWDRF
ncbi:MAG TPA: hypothetical protein PLQ97_09405 [Myxococcota bacterium]|nr:hypothetical protein [Myxococcota bacterium]HQK50994.1 hypothetical protein [Myxococcota bacterium]